MFFSITIGGPVVVHLLILLFSFLKSSFDTLVIVKRAQLVEQKKKQAVEKKNEWTFYSEVHTAKYHYYPSKVQ